MTSKGRLLVIDDDLAFCRMLKRQLDEEYNVAAFSDPQEAVRYLHTHTVDVVLTDLNMPGLDGLEVLQTVKSESFNTDVIIMTAYAKVDSAVKAMKKGAYDYIIKPFSPDELSLQLKNLFEKRKLFEENVNLRKIIDTKYRPDNIIGESEGMKEVYRFIELVAQTDSTVLITGESGTGKELVARALHFSGKRKDRNFVSINCTAMPETLIESELFGYEKGAFTGAEKEKRGLFEYANDGTIFLDEIGDAPLSIQAKLLRVLQEHKFRPIGGDSEIAVDVRVICATNRDLRKLISEDKFREDLFYRINVVAVHLPSLRERSEDIPLLVSRFLEGRKKVHPKALDLMSHYKWLGNVRELKNVIERLVILTDSDTIMPADLPDEILELLSIRDDSGLGYNELKKRVTDEFNRTIINNSLRKQNGNVTKAADLLGIDRANFQRLMRRYNISSKEHKSGP